MEQCSHPITSRYRSIKAPAGELFCLECKQILLAPMKQFIEHYHQEVAEKLLSVLDII